MNEQLKHKSGGEYCDTGKPDGNTNTGSTKKERKQNRHHCGRGGSSGCRGRRWRICSGQNRSIF